MPRAARAETVRIRGPFEDRADIAIPTGLRLEPRAVMRPGVVSRDGGTAAAVQERTFAADDLVRVHFEDDLVLWLRADDLALDYGRREAARDAGASEAWVISGPALPGRDRGLVRVGIRLLEFFGVDLAGKAAATLGGKVELRALGGREGLFRVPLDADKLVLTPVPGSSLPAQDGPILVFVHGTASSMNGSFGGLWTSGPGREARRALSARYGARAFAWEHRSMTRTPMDNALELARALPVGAEVHLVSHSRGGLVGELLCLGSRERADLFGQALDDGRALIEHLFAPDPAMATELGLPRLKGAEAKAQADVRRRQLATFRALLETLDARKLRVRRFVRVACPARGTTLASGRLDRWLSVVQMLLERSVVGGVATELLDFVLAVVKERTDPRSLPGLESMMPASPVVRLLNLPGLRVGADLSVIAGDVQGESIWSRLKLVVTDWFYGGEHDLVVNTPSMIGGARRAAGGARFERDQGPAVTHFNYFQNERTVRLLVSGLTRADDSLGGFRPIETAAEVIEDAFKPIARGGAKAPAPSGPRPVVVVLPGTMGSALRIRDDEIWLSFPRLLFGALGRIAYGRGAEPFALLDSFYGPLVEHLRHSHRVEVFPYDWRHSVREAARHLADRITPLLAECERTAQPLRIVAHSMGGLVTRTFIAAFPALWKRIQALPGSRFLMLGTPNRGSHEALRWLTGLNPTQAKLILLDVTRDRDELIEIVRRYPGLLELLPNAADARMDDAATWKALRKDLDESWPLPEAAQLAQVRATWALVESSPIDPQRMVYVAGCQDQTVVGYQVVESRRGHKALSFLATREGDGTVPWASGRLDGVPTYYVRDTGHDALCTQTRAFAGYVDLLQTGTTTRLPDVPPALARAPGEAETFVLRERPPADSMPGEAEVALLGFSGQSPRSVGVAGSAATTLPPLRISIRHGDLAYARHPVVVGHYLGDSIVAAEKALDRRLGGKLSRQQSLNLYPGAAGTQAVFLQTDARAAPPGAVVVGLGQVGSVSPGGLERAMRQAMLAYASQVADCPDDRFGPADATRAAPLSCLLVATGAGGVSLRDSLDAMLRGALGANAQLQESGLAHRVLIDEIEFVELMEDVAIGAARQLEHLLADEPLRSQIEWRHRGIEDGEGQLRRVRFDAVDGWWQRMEIAYDERMQAMRFIPVTDRARAEEHVVAGQLRLADAFVQRASERTGRDADAARTLFEMLLPNRLKEISPEQRDVVLLVDGVSARYPWELLEDRRSATRRPPAVAAGLLRQLRTPVFRSQPAHPQRATALVIGNPRLNAADFPDLPGAAAEARAVARVLRGHGMGVTDAIGQDGEPVLGALHQDGWRVLHLAGHGVHEHALPEGARVSGMVIGDGVFLTPGDVAQMREVPELVFLNCCHLGSVAGSDRAALAANLAVQFIEMGVRAVIAAGWAVDDAAARAFAEHFYDRMLSGEAFGEAVRSAREHIWDRFPDANTWGAYQCYGEPGFRLVPPVDGAAGGAPATYLAPAELVADLDNLRSRVRMEILDATAASREGPAAGDRVEALLRRMPPDAEWSSRADVAAAIGAVYGEFHDYERAIGWLDRALAADVGECPIRTLEQRANLGVRFAAARWQELRGRRCEGAHDRAQTLELAETIERAIQAIEQLCAYGETVERLRLLGSACKRLAWIRADRGPRVEALTNMAEYYGRAQRLRARRAMDTSALLNAVTAELALSWWAPDAALGNARREALRGRCQDAMRAVREKNESDPDFWSGTGETDATLVLALIDDRIDEAGEQALIEGYRRAIARGASPRERASLIEHLEFLVEMTSGREPSAHGGKRKKARRAAPPPPLPAALTRIRDAL